MQRSERPNPLVETLKQIDVACRYSIMWQNATQNAYLICVDLATFLLPGNVL